MAFRSLARPGFVAALAMVCWMPARAQIGPGVIGGIMGGMGGTLGAGPWNAPGTAVGYALDSSAIRPDLFRRVALREGFHELPGDSGSPCFEYRDPWKWQARVCFRAAATVGDKDETIASAPRLSGDSIPIREDRVFARILVSGEAHGNPGFPVAFWMLGAYLRELRPGMPVDSTYFVPPERKSPAGFRWRNALSMGWGVTYGARGNPFVSQAVLAEGLGFIFDALTGFLMFAGPFVGNHRDDRIALPLIGLGGAIGLRLTVFNSWNLQPGLTLLNSDYPMPRALAERPSSLDPIP